VKLISEIKCITSYAISLTSKAYESVKLGLVLSTKILRSEKFTEKVRKFKTCHFCHKGQKNYLANILAWLAH
jgi:hypothetical protein